MELKRKCKRLTAIVGHDFLVLRMELAASTRMIQHGHCLPVATQFSFATNILHCGQAIM